MGMPAPSEKADDVSLNDMVVLPCDVCCAESRAGAGASADELSAAFGAPWLQAPASNARTILNTGVFIIGGRLRGPCHGIPEKWRPDLHPPASPPIKSSDPCPTLTGDEL